MRPLSFETRHRLEQSDAIYRLVQTTYWEGVESASEYSRSDRYWEWRHQNALAVYRSVCKVIGHQFGPKDQWGMDECNYCGACGPDAYGLDCCSEFYE